MGCIGGLRAGVAPFLCPNPRGVAIGRRGTYNRTMENSVLPVTQTCIEALTEGRSLRVWSIIVTLFGDLAPNAGDTISGPLMGRLVSPMGIKPEAMRVALHRLRGDGWITSEKQGRSSIYRLSEMGLHETRAASPRIYQTTPVPEGHWQICVPPPMDAPARQSFEKTMQTAGYVSLQNGVFLAADPDVKPPEGALVLRGDINEMPDWVRAQNAPEDIMNAYADLERALDVVTEALADRAALPALDRAVLRVLLVHRWRRVLLSHPDLPASAYVAEWRAELCRAKVAELLQMVTKPDLARLA